MGHGGGSEAPANGQHCFASNVSEPLWKLSLVAAGQADILTTAPLETPSQNQPAKLLLNTDLMETVTDNKCLLMS